MSQCIIRHLAFEHIFFLHHRCEWLLQGPIPQPNGPTRVTDDELATGQLSVLARYAPFCLPVYCSPRCATAKIGEKVWQQRPISP